VADAATSHAADWIIAAASVGHYERIAAADRIWIVEPLVPKQGKSANVLIFQSM
jgi:hypothetical protein